MRRGRSSVGVDTEEWFADDACVGQHVTALYPTEGRLEHHLARSTETLDPGDQTYYSTPLYLSLQQRAPH